MAVSVWVLIGANQPSRPHYLVDARYGSVEGYFASGCAPLATPAYLYTCVPVYLVYLYSTRFIVGLG
eukprot:6243039-Pyramimonas_sp.AAC.2